MNDDQLNQLMQMLLDARSIMEEQDQRIYVAYGPGVTAVVAVNEDAEALLDLLQRYTHQDQP